MGTSLGWRERRITRLAAVTGLALIALLIAGCSAGGSGSGGTNISLGLAGSTADHPSAPPSVAASGPNNTYAFVYDDQIWVHNAGSSSQSASCNCQTGNCNPCQLTNLVLSNGADIAWGPLVWSPDGKHLAFALVQNLTPNQPDRTAGPIYVVDYPSGNTIVTPGIGSVYGHDYAWYGNNMLFYASGDGISMYDVGDPDPRVWQVLPAMYTQPNQSIPTFTSNNVVFGDIAITSNDYLYFSEATINSIGGAGVVGTAELNRVALPFSLTGYNGYNSEYSQNASSSPISITEWLYGYFPLSAQNAVQVADLGSAYSDTGGDYTMGSWQVEGNDHHLVWQVITGVSTSKQTVSSNFCFGSPGFGCNQVLSGAGKYSQSLHGQLGLSSDASHVAFAGDQLYLQAVNGGNSANQVSSNSWMQTPALTNNPSLVVATEVVSSSRDANGVLRTNTDLVAFDGQNHYVLIAGAEDASWK